MPSFDLPATTRHQFFSLFKEYLSIADEDAFDVIVATAIHSFIAVDTTTQAGTFDDRSPVWLLLVGPSGGGKTLLAWKPFQGMISHIHNIDQITPRTFITGLKTGQDLLPLLHRKLVLIKDMTSILSMRSEQAAEVFSQLRQIYDGEFTANFGGDKPSKTYRSVFDIIACTTPDAAVRIRNFNAQLGERFIPIYMRVDNSDINRAVARNNGHEKEIGIALHTAMTDLLRSTEPYYYLYDKITLDYSMVEYISSLVGLSTYMKTVVTRDWQQDVSEFPKPDSTGRVYEALMSIMRSVAVLYHHDSITEREIQIIRRMCYYFIQSERLIILEVLLKRPNLRTADLAECVSLPYMTIKKMVSAMSALRLIHEDDGKWSITEQLKVRLDSTGLFNNGIILPDDRPEDVRDLIMAARPIDAQGARGW